MEDTDFDNIEPKTINNINDEIKISNSYMDSVSSTELDGDTAEHPVCNKEARVYKWLNKPFESTLNKFDPPVPVPLPRRKRNTIQILSGIC